MTTDQKFEAKCPDCGRVVNAIGPSKLARHKSYAGNYGSPGWGAWCPQKKDPTANITEAKRRFIRSGLVDAVGDRARNAARAEKQYLEAKSWHDNTQESLVRAREALAAFDREHPAPPAQDETVRAVATFPHRDPPAGETTR